MKNIICIFLVANGKQQSTISTHHNEVSSSLNHTEVYNLKSLNTVLKNTNKPTSQVLNKYKDEHKEGGNTTHEHSLHSFHWCKPRRAKKNEKKKSLSSNIWSIEIQWQRRAPDIPLLQRLESKGLIEFRKREIGDLFLLAKGPASYGP